VALLVIPNLTSLVLTLMNGESGLGWLLGMLRSSAALLLAIAFLWYGYRTLLRVRAIRESLDLIKLSVPWFGSLARRMATARWARALSVLMTAGVPVQRALRAAGAASGNAEIRRGMQRAAGMTEQGRGVAESVATVRQIPRMALDMLTTAEQAGSVELALDKVADYYESETEVGGKQTALIVGVLLFLVIAGAIAFTVISFWGSIGQAYTHAVNSIGE
jgi:type IV pilus assembly protein PilC